MKTGPVTRLSSGAPVQCPTGQRQQTVRRVLIPLTTEESHTGRRPRVTLNDHGPPAAAEQLNSPTRS